MKTLRTWALIADSAQARILANSGPLHGEEGHDQARHGWSDATLGTESALKADTQPVHGHQQASATIKPEHSATTSFAQQLASLLDHQLSLGAYYRLIIAAPPAMLGELRHALSAHVRKSLVGEFHHDLTKIPNAEIADHLKLNGPG